MERIRDIIPAIIVALIVAFTGGADSPLFFLLYAAALSLGVLTSPAEGFIYTIVMIMIIIIFKAPQSPNELFTFAHVFLLLPLGLIVRKEALRREKQRMLGVGEAARVLKDDVGRFGTALLEHQLLRIEEAARQFRGDEHLRIIRNSVAEMQKLFRSLKHEK